MGQIIYITDGSGTQKVPSKTLREENEGMEPTHLNFTSFYNTTGIIKNISVKVDGYCRGKPHPWKEIAWLIEPRCLHPENYEIDFSNFDAILTYDKELLDKYPDKARFYPLGGSSIALEKWKLYPKSKNVCMIVSDKKTTEGHKLRYKIAEEFGDRIDLYGAGVGKPFDSKFEMLKDYKFCIVVESCRLDYYFTEKLIDSISVGCIPIYNGAICADPRDKPQFKMFHFSNIYQLKSILDYQIQDYPFSFLEQSLEENLEEAKKYRIAEDQIFELHGDLFHE